MHSSLDEHLYEINYIHATIKEINRRRHAVSSPKADSVTNFLDHTILPITVIVYHKNVRKMMLVVGI
jgi:hypothetical protein